MKTRVLETQIQGSDKVQMINERKIQQQLNQRLYNAVRMGDIVMVKRAVMDGGEPQIPPHFMGRTPHELAILMERKEKDQAMKETYSEIKKFLEEAIRNISID
jgi:hypothetical protein